MKAQKQIFQKGMIILWSGLIADIPGGWQLCDGTNGTPNLKNSFIVGAGDTYVVAATGGSTFHDHVIDDEEHLHDISAGAAIAAGSDFGSNTDSSLADLSLQNANHLPPYYALAYIMKL